MQGFYYVRTNGRQEREFLVKMLRSIGFSIEKDSRNLTEQDILEDILPFRVNMVSKEYGIMGNVTCAAAAASSKVLTEYDDFLQNNAEKFMF